MQRIKDGIGERQRDRQTNRERKKEREIEGEEKLKLETVGGHGKARHQKTWWSMTMLSAGGH